MSFECHAFFLCREADGHEEQYGCEDIFIHAYGGFCFRKVTKLNQGKCAFFYLICDFIVSIEKFCYLCGYISD